MNKPVVRTVCVLDDTHTDEWAADVLFQALHRWPIDGVYSMRANDLTRMHNQATGERRRYTNVSLSDQHLKRRPVKDAPIISCGHYEPWRAPQVRAAARAFDVAVEPHGNEEGYTWALYGMHASSLVVAAAGSVVDFAMVGDELTLPFVEGNTVAIDYPYQNRERYLAEMYRLLYRLSHYRLGSDWRYGQVPTEYRFEKNVMVDAIEKHNLPPVYEPLMPLPEWVTKALEVPPDAVPMVWNLYKYGERTGCAAELVVPYHGQSPEATKAGYCLALGQAALQ